jgi:hypothetical protein
LRPQAFAASRRLPSPDAARACSIPVTPLGFQPSRAFLPAPSRAHLVGCRALLPFPPRFPSGFRALLRARIRAPGIHVSGWARGRCSPGLSFPPGFQASTAWRLQRAPPPLGLPACGSLSRRRVPSGVSIRGDTGESLPRPTDPPGIFFPYAYPDDPVKLATTVNSLANDSGIMKQF